MGKKGELGMRKTDRQKAGSEPGKKNTALKPGFGWVRMGAVQKDEEALRLLKEIIKKYPDLKEYCRFFEKSRRSILEMAGAADCRITFLEAGKVAGLLRLPLVEEDRAALRNYLTAATQAMALEMGMEGLPEGLYREIAYDRYFGRMGCREVMEKYGVSRDTVRRAGVKVNGWLAEYARWYMELAEKVEKGLEG